MNSTELSKSDNYKEQVRADLKKLRAEVDELKSIAEQQKELDRNKFDEYLETLDEKREDVVAKLDSIGDNSTDAYDDIKKGMKEAWQRLAIAKQAAAARFH